METGAFYDFRSVFSFFFFIFKILFDSNYLGKVSMMKVEEDKK